MDDVQNLQLVSASRSDGLTTISFRRPRLSSDENDISLDECRYFLFGWGGDATVATQSIGYHPSTPIVSQERICLPSPANCPGGCGLLISWCGLLISGCGLLIVALLCTFLLCRPCSCRYCHDNSFHSNHGGVRPTCPLLYLIPSAPHTNHTHLVGVAKTLYSTLCILLFLLFHYYTL